MSSMSSSNKIHLQTAQSLAENMHAGACKVNHDVMSLVSYINTMSTQGLNDAELTLIRRNDVEPALVGGCFHSV